MKIIRKKILRQELQSIFIPEEFGETIEVVILPGKQLGKKDDEILKSLESLQEVSGFVAQVLTDKEEEIWNEI